MSAVTGSATTVSPGRPASSLRAVWAIIKPRRGQGAVALLLSCLSLICAIALIATSGWLISRAWQQPPILALGVAVVSVRAFGIGRGVFRYAERLVSHSAALRGLTDLRVKAVERLAVVAPGGIGDLRRGDATRRIVDDVDTTADLGLRVLLPASSAVIVGALVVGFVAWLLPGAAIALLVGLLIGGIAAPGFARAVGMRAAGAQAAAQGALAAQISEQLNTTPDLVAARATAVAGTRVRELDDEIRALEYTAARGMGLAAGVGVAAQGIALLGVILIAVPAVGSGSLAGVNLATLILIPLVAFELVAGLPTAALALVRTASSAGRVIDLLNLPDPVPDPENPHGLPTGPARLHTAGLTVTWPGATSPAVVGVDLDLSPGRRVALIGPSGSGKSSLAAALVRFAPYQGYVTLNGVQLDQLSGDEVRAVIGLCSQDAHIFDNTIAANVQLARPNASEAEVEAALRKARLWDWIEGLPSGVNTYVGEGGSQLSGGQRQRLALARILLAGTPIVIVDEPTEHLDVQTADLLTADILAQTANCATLLITHTLRGLAHVDEVIVLSDGHVIERGTPAELIAAGGWLAEGIERETAGF